MLRLCPRHGARQGRAPGAMSPSRRHLPTRITHGHGTIRRDGDIAPYRHYTRKIRTARCVCALRTTTGHTHRPRGALPTPQKTPAVAHRLCAPIHPAQKLFMPLCVQHSRTRITPGLGARASPVRAPHPPGSRRHPPSKMRFDRSQRRKCPESAFTQRNHCIHCKALLASFNSFTEYTGNFQSSSKGRSGRYSGSSTHTGLTPWNSRSSQTPEGRSGRYSGRR